MRHNSRRMQRRRYGLAFISGHVLSVKQKMYLPPLFVLINNGVLINPHTLLTLFS